jgi:hypothetical protein
MCDKAFCVRLNDGNARTKALDEDVFIMVAYLESMYAKSFVKLCKHQQSQAAFAATVAYHSTSRDMTMFCQAYIRYVRSKYEMISCDIYI